MPEHGRCPVTRIFTWNDCVRVSFSPRTEKKQEKNHLKDVYPCYLRGYSDRGWFKLPVHVAVKKIDEATAKTYMDTLLGDAEYADMDIRSFSEAFGYSPDDEEVAVSALVQCTQARNYLLKALSPEKLAELISLRKEGKESTIK